MNRYLYRAKRTDNGEWVEGYYCKRKTGRYTTTGFVEEYKDRIIREFSDGGISWCYINPETICRCTGLTDKNNNNIWENNIIKCGRDLMVVKWNDKSACWCLRKKGWMYDHFFNEACDPADCEVVGNIFDNPIC